MASVAGAGTGKRPCAQFTQPVPSDDRRGQHARLAQHFQRDAGAHDVHDGIHRADFVEMNFVRRQAVDLPLRLGDALEDGDWISASPTARACSAR